MIRFIKVLVLTAFVTSGLAASFLVPPTGCRLKVVNSGAPGTPDYSRTTCEGNCVSPDVDPCTVDVYAGSNGASFSCLCDGKSMNQDLTTQDCISWISNYTGTWYITCRTAKCVAKCIKADLPASGSSVWACVCPDAP